MNRTKDYRQALWLPPESQYYHKFPYLQGTVGHFYGDCHHSWMSLSRILFGWQEHLDKMAWQDVSGTVPPTTGEAPGSGFGVLVLEKSSPVRILSSDSEESDCLGWKYQNAKTSPALAHILGARWLCSNGSKVVEKRWAGCKITCMMHGKVWGNYQTLLSVGSFFALWVWRCSIVEDSHERCLSECGPVIWKRAAL